MGHVPDDLRSALDDLFSIIEEAGRKRTYSLAVHSVALGLQAVLRRGHDDLIAASQAAGGQTGILVFGSDQDLCGSFNEQVVSFALDFVDGRDGIPEKAIACVGSRAYAVLEERGRQPGDLFSVPGSLGGVTPLIQDLLLRLEEWQRTREISRVIVFHNRPVSYVSYTPNAVRVLPLDPEWAGTFKYKKWPSHVLPVYTMDRMELFPALVSQYIFVSLFRALAESMASEDAGRLSSMQAAERNIEERLDDLGDRYRNQRQESITDELLDIVSGFEALRSP